MSAKPLPPPLARSLQDLRHLKQALAQARADEQARLRTARELAEKTEAARHVFAHAVGKVRPLAGAHQSRVMLAPAPVLPRPLQRERDQEAVLREALSDAFDFSTLLETDESLSYRQPGIGMDVVRKLRQGHWSIQHQLDLHGLRRDDAREALGCYVRECQRRGLRCVRVITGKGLGSPGKTPVLKNKVYGWLIQKKEVLAFVQARPTEGGAGALVVLLAPASRGRRA
ncbi:MAG: Smr/MutS family protein [Brachymonas sp.]